MTFAFDPPDNTVIPSERLVSGVASSRIAEVRVAYDEELVYQTVDEVGGFVEPFLESSISDDGKTLAVKRTGGWQRSFATHVEEGAGAATMPSLQPLDTAVVAAWRQDYAIGGSGVNTMQLVDRSGNGYHGQASSGILTVPDVIAGRLAAFPWLTNNNSPPSPLSLFSAGGSMRGLSVPGWGPQTELLGDLTFTARVAQSGQQGAFPHYQYIYAHGDAGTSRGISFGIGIEANTYNVFVYWEDLGGANSSLITFGPTISQLLRSFRHCFISLVRDATAKTLRLGINGTYETQTYTQDPPPSRTGRYPFVCAPPSSTGSLTGVMGFCGMAPDIAIRDKTRADAELDALRLSTMGAFA